MKFLELAKSRYTSKAYDASKKIPAQQLQNLLEVLRLSPSSINIQPWKFIAAQSATAKQKIAEAMPGNFSYNIPKILNASDVIIFTAKNDIDETHLDNILNCEEQAGRFRTPDSKLTQKNVRQTYIDLYKQNNLIHDWIDNQVHIALGALLFAAKAENIDATPIGGFDRKLLDEILQLDQQGLHSVVLVALGYHSDEDFNTTLGKGRLSYDQVISII
ncbi:oxygen-insensitive NAD(P)H nitroreductase [Acinetobacter qingfengensis]|uniref:NAD(P)H nitroreductase n=1 Tax=Acinetobacter qingfengensis TaxID=1262585 RepID=A0A1E7RCF2_9GAMM|nr:oxygen-insensitive NAD(P)H nitroreductase [Acinetobacter qingfengensis]KAA8734854.1 oxygen-insensitive NAD(P)H nitroreductase [Acinetobacter qingfengensis]OEY96897.1 NAD(P)H nitroreductase [Acinetobacter qingfengensis]